MRWWKRQGTRDANAFDSAAARDEQLSAYLDGALSPAERVRLVESLTDELTVGRKPRKPFVLGFDTFADYDTWLRAGGPGTK